MVNPEPLDPDLLILYHEPEYLALLREASEGNVRPRNARLRPRHSGHPHYQGDLRMVLRACGGTHHAAMEILSGGRRWRSTRWAVFTMPCPAMPKASAISTTSSSPSWMLCASPGHQGRLCRFRCPPRKRRPRGFLRRSSVLFLSVHETGRTLYPWSGSETEIGKGAGEGYTVNFPLEPGTDDEVYSYVLDSAGVPDPQSLAPDFIVARDRSGHPDLPIHSLT